VDEIFMGARNTRRISGEPVLDEKKSFMNRHAAGAIDLCGDLKKF